MKSTMKNERNLQHLDFYLNLIEIKFNLYIVSYKSWSKAFIILKEHKDSDNEIIKSMMYKLAKSLKDASVICLRAENKSYEEALKEIEEYLGNRKALGGK